MKTNLLGIDEVLQGYDAVVKIYPHTPSLSHWRAWEYAAYQRYQLQGRILDLGCGNGRYFNLLWPNQQQVVGVDISSDVVMQAEASGVYNTVHLSPAHQIPEADASFDHVFANCSLEHMDNLDQVLAEISRCLKPNGTLLCSVVTHRFVDWELLSRTVALAGHGAAGQALRRDFLRYHHLTNPLSPDQWEQRLINAHLNPEQHIPIVPKYNSSAFLLMDSLWHLQTQEGKELGGCIFPVLASNPNFPQAFRTIFEGLLKLETDWFDCSGAVILARKVV